MELSSRKVTISKSADDLFAYLSDVSNFEQLMPDNTSKFEMIRDDAFVFALKGMPEIALEVKEVERPAKIILGAMSDKIPFQLTGNIVAQNENSSEVQLVFEGDFNPMMAMMIKGPITNFLETLVSKLEQI